MYENCLLLILYTVNIWRAFDMNENIVTRKFLTQFLRTKLMRITAYDIIIMRSGPCTFRRVCYYAQIDDCNIWGKQNSKGSTTD